MSDAAHGRIAELRADVVVIGDGLIGLSVALELLRRGASVRCVGSPRPGVASSAAAGLLAATGGALPEPVQRFFDASLALYPEFVDALRDVDPALTIVTGLLHVGDAVEGTSVGSSQRVAGVDLKELEPELAVGDVVFYPRDGSIDNEQLLPAVRAAVDRSAPATLVRDAVVEITAAGGDVAIRTARHATYVASAAVVAAGAWTSAIRGLPRPLPVSPLKGQMLALGTTPLRHPIVGEDVYIVPRRKETLVGATVERAGFDTATDQPSIDRLHAAATALVPSLRDAPITRTWAGLRPGTPDLLPIIGRDPSVPSLIYACGHSKNGILLAPATAQSVAALACGAPPPHDLTPFAIERFGGRSSGAV